MPPKKRAASPVPDDWENDDSDEEGDEEHNRRIWEEANAKASAPMPTIVSASSMGQTLPPAAALQPTLRILKRPSPSPSTPDSSSNSSTSDPSTLKEREARYQAARERIFGADSTSSTPPASSPAPGANTITQPPVARIVREPRGPSESKDSESGQEIKGFARREGTKAAAPLRPND